MSTQIQQDIIARTKQVLEINKEISNSDLYTILNQEMSGSHPDRFSDAKVKKQAEEKFKLLNGLRAEFKVFLEQERLNHQVTTYEKESDQLSIDTITKNTDLELEVLSLKKKLESKDWTIEYNNTRLRQAEEKFTSLVADYTELAKEKISDIYKPKKIGTVVGIGSACGSLAILIPQVQRILFSMGIGGLIASTVVIILALIWIFRYARNFMVNKYIESLIDKIIIGTNLMEELNVVVPDEKYPKPYFTEYDIVALVERHMNKSYIQCLLYGSYNSIKRNIVEYIILEFERKRFIVDIKTSDMVKKFFIEHNNTSKTDYSF